LIGNRENLLILRNENDRKNLISDMVEAAKTVDKFLNVLENSLQVEYLEDVEELEEDIQMEIEFVPPKVI
jgi:hypothetical protein